MKAIACLPQPASCFTRSAMEKTTIHFETDWRGSMAQTRPLAPTPLAMFVRERLAQLEISQSDFCRRSTFDQGLLSKIQNSLVTSLSIESILKLAVGLSAPPQQLFQLIDRMDLHDLVVQSYASELAAVVNGWLQPLSPELAAKMQQLISEASSVKSGVVRTRRRRWPREARAEAVNGAPGTGGSAGANSANEDAEELKSSLS